MISRRTKARISFVSSLYRAYQRCTRVVNNEETVQFAPRYFVLGFIYQIVRGWTYDRDYGNNRTNRWRRFLIPVAIFPLLLKLLDLISESERESLVLGAAVGAILYRLWYGVLNPLPDIVSEE